MRALMSAVVATTVLAASAPAAAQPVQAAFDAGEALLKRSDAAGAVAAFSALETRLARGNPRSLAAVRARLGQALAGAGEEARAADVLGAALAVLDPVADRGVRVDALDMLGRLEERALMFPEAAGRYREALALAADGGDKAQLRVALARVDMFDDPARAADLLAGGLAEARAMMGKDKRQLGQYLAVLGRAQMNAGRLVAARATLREALSFAGGLTTERVDLAQIAVRWDAALAAELAGDRERAAELIAYTGAGLTKDGGLNVPDDAEPPACGGGIAPEDRVVIGFVLAEDGAVARAMPVYASRPGPIALEFARAVAGWRWPAAAARKIDPFFRSAARLELRCTTRAERLPLDRLAFPDLKAWARALPAAGPGSLRIVVGWNGELGVDEAARPGRQQAADELVIALPAEPGTGAKRGGERDKARADYRRLAAYAERTGAPPLARAWLETRAAAELPATSNYYAYTRARAAALRALADADRFNDARARAYVAVEAADAAGAARKPAEAAELLARVAGTGGLAVDDPIRQAAAIRLASAQAALGDRAAAERTFATTGIAAEQCALLDAAPRRVRVRASENDMPSDAQRFGFSGWAVTEFDVLTDGRTRGSRPVIVYPPFLFGESAAKITARSVYAPTFRPAGAVSCGGYRDRVRYNGSASQR